MARSYEILCDDKDPTWLTHRHGLLTASDVCTAMGLNRFTTRDELIMRKAAGVPYVIKDNPPMWHGRENEDNNRRKFGKASGLLTKGCRWLLKMDGHQIGCTLDGLIVAPQEPRPIDYAMSDDSKKWLGGLVHRVREAEGVGVLEMKQTKIFNAKKWKDSMPDYHVHQVQTQLMITGKQWGVICCQIGSDSMKAFYVEADKEIQEEIKHVARDFWDHVALARI